MEQKDKELLLRDLSARLPYGVICKSKYIEYDDIDGDDTEWDVEGKLEVVGDDYVIINSYQCEIEYTKPYLRSLSRMTKEERDKLGIINCMYVSSHDYGVFYQSQDFLNSIHVDYRELIEKGLALEALEGMY